MKLNIVIAALVCAAFVWMGMPQPSRGAPESYEVIATAYTCDNHPRNPFRCGPLRWGGDINAPGMACPAEWRNRVMEVPGYGNLRCDDTGAYSFMNGLPHIDIRVATYEEARRLGVRRMTIRPATTTVVEEPVSGITSPEAAIATAHEMVPTGDASTAMARLLYLDTARKRFPTIMGEVNLPGNQPLWVVTLWVPPSEIPAGTQAQPNPADGVAAKMFVFDPSDGSLILDGYVSKSAIETMGWIPSDKIDLGQ